MRKISFLLMMMIAVKNVSAQFSITTPTVTYNQFFNLLASTGASNTWTDNVTLTGWYAKTDATASITTYGANTGGTTTAGLYSFGVTGQNPLTERALGWAASNAFTGASGTGKGYIGWRLVNNTGATITSLNVSYTGEQWRRENVTANSLLLTYQTGATVTSLTGGTWTSTTGTFTSPQVSAAAAALDGNLPANRVTPISVTINVSIPAGQEIMLRWEDLNDAGNDHHLAIDDVSVTAFASVGNSATGYIFSDNMVFTPPTNIVPKDYQGADVTMANSIELGMFQMHDGTNDADALPLTLTSLSFTVTNSSVFRRVALYDNAGNELGEVAGGSTVTFNGLNYTAPDNSFGVFYLRVTYNPIVTDNTQSVFTITSATTDPAGSSFSTADAGGAATYATTADENTIRVTATHLTWVQNVTSPVGVNVAMTPFPALAATDINGSRDLDYNSPIVLNSTAFPPIPTNFSGTIVSGLATFNNIIHTNPYTAAQLFPTGITLLYTQSDFFDVVFASGITDRFRSFATGDWNVAANWESSADGITWIPSSLVPNENANTITIRNGHTITVSTAVTADQVTIENGGVLINSANALTIADGTGDDVIIQSGGIFTLASSAGPLFTGAAPVVNINGNGILRISRSGYTSAGGGMNAANYVYQNGAIAEYTLNSAFSTSGVTFFPNVDASTIPIFRFTGTTVSAGSGGTTIFNGVFDAVGNMTFTGAGVKTFRNGITGAGNFNGSASGKFIISGATASLGGSGTLTLPTVNGLEIATGSTLTLNSSKTIAGNIALLANSFIALGNNDLTITGAITGGATDRYVRTNGTGVLTINNIAAPAVVLPIGNSTYNPLTIANGSGLNWSARVEDALNNVVAPFNTDKAINRTWHIAPSAVVTSGPSITFNFDDSDPGQLANAAAYAADGNRLARFWHYGGAWVSASGSMPMTPSPDLQTLTLTGYTSFSPFAIAKTTGALPVEFGNIRAKQQGSGVKIEWTNYTELDVLNYVVERSINGRDFITITNATPRLNDGTRADYSILDASPVNGINYYRVRSAETNGQVKYSSVVKVDLRGGRTDITLYPNPVNSNSLSLQATSLAKGQYNIKVFNAAGQQVAAQTLNHNGGSVTEPVQLPGALKAGLYQLVITGEAMNTTKTFVVQ